MNYKSGNKITINNKSYTINNVFFNYYKINLNNKRGLMDKVTCKIVVEPIYDGIWEYNNHYEIILNGKYGLMDKVNCKVILNPEHTNVSYEDLVKIYNDLIIKSKMRIEKLRQLEEML